MLRLFIVGCLIFFAFGASAEGPSFNCENAGTIVEKEICSSEILSTLDLELASAYGKFRSKFSDESLTLATKLQRHWIKSRDRNCTKPLYQSLFAGQPESQYGKVEKTLEACLERYYRKAIDSFRKGVLTSSISLLPGDKSIDVGVHGIDKIEIVKSDVIDKYSNCQIVDGKVNGDFERGEIYLVLNGNRYHLGRNEIDNCSGNNNWQKIISDLRFYLLDTGELYLAAKSLNVSLSGRCDVWHWEYLDFISDFNADGSVVFFQGDEDKGIIHITLLYDSSLTCGGAIRKLYSWQAGEGTLFFYYEDGESSDVYGNSVESPELYTVEVNGIRGVYNVVLHGE